jgi:hypothetical protein
MVCMMLGHTCCNHTRVDHHLLITHCCKLLTCCWSPTAATINTADHPLLQSRTKHTQITLCCFHMHDAGCSSQHQQHDIGHRCCNP